MNGVFPEDCRNGSSEDQFVYHKDLSCSAIKCNEHRGACCLGKCRDDVPASECGSPANWFKDASCSDPVVVRDCAEPAIPTVSAWGLVVLTLLLLTAWKVRFGRLSQRPA